MPFESPPSSAPSPPPAARPWHLTVAYDGTAYHGWASQPGLSTLRDTLESRLQRLFRQPDLQIAATSRTDAGVHALDQHVSFTPTGTPVASLDPEQLPARLNRWLPPEVRVLTARVEAPGFHARYAARGKAYVYCIATNRAVTPFAARYAWHLWRPLDLAAMRAAAARLTGTRDFASFGANPRRDGPNPTICTLHRLELTERPGFLFVTVLGDRFLYKMVRGLTGFLVHVGLNSIAPEAADAALAAHSRTAVPDNAPACGLFLARVFFSDEAWPGYQPPLPPFAPG